MTVHALGGDGEHCRCGELWPDAGWLAQQADLDHIGKRVAVDTYRDHGTPPDTLARLEAALIGGARGSE